MLEAIEYLVNPRGAGGRRHELFQQGLHILGGEFVHCRPKELVKINKKIS